LKQIIAAEQFTPGFANDSVDVRRVILHDRSLRHDLEESKRNPAESCEIESEA
jgi:hypothetical protein